MNALFYGDNLHVLRDHSHFPNEFVDLIYLDPPFNSKRVRTAKERVEKTATLRELAMAIPGRVAKSKDRLPLFKLASFGDVPTVHGSLRHDHNLRRPER